MALELYCSQCGTEYWGPVQNAPKDWQGKEASDILNDMMDKQIKHSFN